MGLVINGMKNVMDIKQEYKGGKIVKEAPVLRHFTVKLKML